MSSAVNRNQVLHALRASGSNLRKWCEENDYGYRNASNVLRGISRAHFGEGKEIADKLNELARNSRIN
nr:DNA-binding protein [uncultured Comamonas sp.]